MWGRLNLNSVMTIHTCKCAHSVLVICHPLHHAKIPLDAQVHIEILVVQSWYVNELHCMSLVYVEHLLATQLPGCMSK